MSQFLVVVIVAVLLILGALPPALLEGQTEYTYSDEQAFSQIVTIRDNNGTLSTGSNPEVYSAGIFNITLATQTWYHPIAINRSVSEARIEGIYYAETPFGQGGFVTVTQGADLAIVAGDIVLNVDFPKFSMGGEGGGWQSLPFAYTLNRTFLDLTNTSSLSVTFECTAAAVCNYSYFVNYGIYLGVNLRYEHEIASPNPSLRISVMTLGVCSAAFLVFETAESRRMRESS